MEKTFEDLIKELAASTAAHQEALNELEQVMLMRGLVTRESLAQARLDMAHVR